MKRSLNQKYFWTTLDANFVESYRTVLTAEGRTYFLTFPLLNTIDDPFDIYYSATDIRSVLSDIVQELIK